MANHRSRYLWAPAALVVGLAGVMPLLSADAITVTLLGSSRGSSSISRSRTSAWPPGRAGRRFSGVRRSGNGDRWWRRRRWHSWLVGHPGRCSSSPHTAVRTGFGFGASFSLLPWWSASSACSNRSAARDRPVRPSPPVRQRAGLLPAVFAFSSPYAAVAGLTVAHGLQYLLLITLLAVFSPSDGSTGWPARADQYRSSLGLGLNHASHADHATGISRAIFGVYLGLSTAHFVIDAGLWACALILRFYERGHCLRPGPLQSPLMPSWSPEPCVAEAFRRILDAGTGRLGECRPGRRRGRTIPWTRPSCCRARSRSTNRLLVLAALADGPSRLVATAAGARHRADGGRAARPRRRVTDDGGDWLVTPAPLHGGAVDTGLAGTVMRFVPPLAALADGPVTFDGDAYARERPMSTLLDGLRQGGVEIEDDGRGAHALHRQGRGSVVGGRVQHGRVGVLAVRVRAPARRGPLRQGHRIVHRRRPRPFPPAHRDDAGSAARRRRRGHRARAGHLAYRPRAHRRRHARHRAGPLQRRAVPRGRDRHGRDGHACPTGPPSRPRRATRCATCSRAMGAEVALDDDTLEGLRHRRDHRPRGRSARHQRARDRPRRARRPRRPPLAAHRSRPHARSRDRPPRRALQRADRRRRRGGRARRRAHRGPGDLHAAPWRTYADHRMATAGAVLGLAVEGVEIDDIGATTKTLPDFPGMWSALVGG